MGMGPCPCGTGMDGTLTTWDRPGWDPDHMGPGLCGTRSPEATPRMSTALLRKMRRGIRSRFVFEPEWLNCWAQNGRTGRGPFWTSKDGNKVPRTFVEPG
eukprot:jgi/Botrbrau1/10929/Bobra.0025s0102.1